MRHIKDLLEGWGNWSMTRIGTEHKAISCIAIPKDDDRPWLSDEEGEIVDKAVAGLKKYDIDGYNIICMHYQNNFSFRKIAKEIERHHSYVSNMCERAECYIAGIIFVLLKNI